MHPVSQDFLRSVSRTFRPSGYEETVTMTMMVSFRQRGINPLIALAVMAEGFGPGWSAKEVCDLTLQALRNQFVEAEGDQIVDILQAGLLAAHKVVFERATAYAAVGEIGCRVLAAVLVGNRCLIARVGSIQAFLSEREGGLRGILPILAAGKDDFLGSWGNLPLVRVSPDDGVESEVGVPLLAGDIVVLANGALAPRLAAVEEQATNALGRLSLDRAADRLLKIGQGCTTPGDTNEQGSRQELAVLLIEIPGAAQSAAAVLPRAGGVLVLGLGILTVVAMVLWGGIGWLGKEREEITEIAPAPIPTASIHLPPPPTDLPHLPTPFRTAIPTPTPTQTPTPTWTPTLSPTNSPTSPPPTETPSAISNFLATELPSVTAVPPSATRTLTPSPSIPAGPILVGARVVVTGTESFGVSLRDAPGVGSDRLLVIYDGEQLEVIGGPEVLEDLTWWQLRTATGAEGWAVARYLQGIAAP